MIMAAYWNDIAPMLCQWNDQDFIEQSAYDSKFNTFIQLEYTNN